MSLEQSLLATSAHDSASTQSLNTGLSTGLNTRKEGQPQVRKGQPPSSAGQPQKTVQFPIDAQVVIKNNPSLCNLHKVGKLGCALAVHTYFGDEVLKSSTLHGKGKLPELDETILNQLVCTIRVLPEFSFMDSDTFNFTVTKAIYKAITHRCKYTRSRSGLTEE